MRRMWLGLETVVAGLPPLGPTQNLGPIGSVVLTFIGYKQTDTQTDL